MTVITNIIKNNMPKAKQKIYQYSPAGKFIKEYESQSEVRKKYFSNDIGVRPIIRNNEYEILPDNSIITKKRVGKAAVKNIWKVANNPFIKLGYNNDAVNVYNLKEVLIAKFASIKIASLLTNIPTSTIYSQVYSSTTKIVKNKSGLLFKLDESKGKPKK